MVVVQNCVPVHGGLKTALRLTTSAIQDPSFLDLKHRVRTLRSCYFTVTGVLTVKVAVEQAEFCVPYAVHER
jgi:hypothetical protein